MKTLVKPGPTFIAAPRANGTAADDTVLGVVTVGAEPLRIVRWPAEGFASLKRRAAYLLPDEQVFMVAYTDHDPGGRFAGAQEAGCSAATVLMAPTDTEEKH